jgi:hypothetical protein
VLINQAPRHKNVWGSGDTAPPFFTSALDGGEWSVSRPGRFTSGETAHDTPCGPQNRYGHYGEKKYIVLAGNQTPANQIPRIYMVHKLPPTNQKLQNIFAGPPCCYLAIYKEKAITNTCMFFEDVFLHIISDS